MGLTRQQKAAREDSLKRSALRREAAASTKRLANEAAETFYMMDQVESMLVVQAFSVVENGRKAIPIFEYAEREFAAYKRAEAVLEKYNVLTLDDLKRHFERALPLTRKECDAKGKARWSNAAKSAKSRETP